MSVVRQFGDNSTKIKNFRSVYNPELEEIEFYGDLDGINVYPMLNFNFDNYYQNLGELNKLLNAKSARKAEQAAKAFKENWNPLEALKYAYHSWRSIDGGKWYGGGKDEHPSLEKDHLTIGIAPTPGLGKLPKEIPTSLMNLEAEIGQTFRKIQTLRKTLGLKPHPSSKYYTQAKEIFNSLNPVEKQNFMTYLKNTGLTLEEITSSGLEELKRLSNFNGINNPSDMILTNPRFNMDGSSRSLTSPTWFHFNK